MNEITEFDIQVLEANGYSYRNGGIVDANGNYLESVELNGKTYTSEADFETWKILEESFYRSSEKNSSLNQNDLILRNMNTYNEPETFNYQETKPIKTNSTYHKTVNTPDTTDYSHFYKYPIVVIASFLIYLIIKKIIK